MRSGLRSRNIGQALVAALLLVLPTALVAEDFTYTSDGSEITITGYTGAGGAAVIPDTIIGLPVTALGPDVFFDNNELESVTIPDSVISIGESAFEKCTKMTSVTLGNSVTSIGESAFADCALLRGLTIPDSVTSVGISAFQFTGLWEVYFEGDAPTTVGANVFAGSDNVTVYYLPGATGWTATFADRPAQALYEYSSNGSEITITRYTARSFFDETIVIPSTIIGLPVTSIGPSAFPGAGLGIVANHVTIPDTVISIGDFAFVTCTNLTSVTFGNSVTSIGTKAFFLCLGLTSVTIPDSVTSIGEGAFQQCTKMTSVTFGNGATSIGSAAFFGCTSLTSVTFGNGDGGTSIGDSAFSGCLNLPSVTIPDSVTSIGEGAFSGCTSLTSVTIGNGVTSIGDFAFTSCSNLTIITVAAANTHYSSADGVLFNVDQTTLIQWPRAKAAGSYTLPDSVTSIGQTAFYSCQQLTSVTIGNSVTSIGTEAFRDCSGLREVYFEGDAPTTVGANVFDINPFFGPNNVTVYYLPGATGWTATFAGRPTQVLYEYSSNGSEITITRYHRPGTAAVIPNTIIGLPVTAIGPDVFYDNRELKTSVTIPDSVISIGEGAFSQCKFLTNVTFGNSVTSIGDFAFSNCTRLTNVTIPDSVTSIGLGAFTACYNLTNVTIPDSVTSIAPGAFQLCTGLTSVTIPDSVTSIGLGAFQFCLGLTSVTIPDSVTSIGERAFANCDLLQRVTIGNRVTSIGTRAFSDCSELREVYFEGDAPTTVGAGVFLTNIAHPNNVTVYYLPGTTGWTATFAGRPTVLWGFNITHASREGTTYTIDFTFTGDQTFTDWKIMGSSDLLTFPDDLTGDSVITQPTPGTFRAVVELGASRRHYFLRINR